VEKGSLFINEILIEMPITTNNSIYINRAIAGDKTLKDTQIFEGTIFY
jgi:hypothetical protein